MPELPEVECIRRSLEPLLVGREVLAAVLRRRDVLIAPGDPVGGFARQRSRAARPKPFTPSDLLVGTTVERIDRRGKQLAIIARPGNRSPDESPLALVVQLGMTGGLLFDPKRRPVVDPHTHALWRFPHGQLTFHDPRRFGALRVFRSARALEDHWLGLGSDALTLSPDALRTACAGSQRAIKAVLMDQALIAGIGNIYADESLFRAGVHPARKAATLRPEPLARLAREIQLVLSAAVAAGGTTLQDFADADGRPGAFQTSHAVYGRAGSPCIACQSNLHSGVLAQRTTVWCPNCQPLRGAPPKAGLVLR